MRTVAIILVLIFHLNEKYLSGGFIGVDIFFVISGYIITRNIVTEIEQGSFSFANFYWRRVMRLVPAAAVTIAVSLVAASFVYSPAILREFGETAFFAATWTVNIFFWLHSGYWDDAAQSNIFLHMWSLSVEEQFYLVWPLLVLLIARVSKQLAIAFALITVAGAVGTYITFRHSPTFAFYMMPARVFQFALGAAVAMAHLRYPATFTGHRAAFHAVIFGIGLSAIGLSAWFADGNAYNIWVAAMLPTAGAAAAIFAMNSWLGRALLAPRPVQYVGRRAYSLYLVHWPLMVMTGIFYGVDKPWTVDAVILISCFALGEILFRLVENRFRMRTWNVGSYRQQISAVSFGAISLLGAGHFWVLNPLIKGATEHGASVSYVQSARSGWRDRSALARISKENHCVLGLTEPFEVYSQKNCLLKPATDKILIIGDSMASEAYIILSQIFDERRLVLAGSSGCVPVYPDPGGKRPQGCQDFTNARYDWANHPDISAIAITSNWQWWKPRDMDSTFARLAESGKPVIIIGVRPRFSTQIPKLLDSAAWGEARKDVTPYIAFPMDERAAQLQDSARRHGSLFLYLALEKYLCPSTCPALHADGSLVYLDQIHITGQTALNLGKQIDRDQGSRLREFVDAERQNLRVDDARQSSR